MSPPAAQPHGPFSGLAFVLELGTVSLQKKKELLTAIEKNGGAIEYVITKKTTHVVTTPQLLGSFKIKSAEKHGCFIVTEDFIIESTKRNAKVDEWPYLYIGSQPASVYGTSSESFVTQHLFTGYTNVASIITALAHHNPASLLSEATTNIAALCLSLGAVVQTKPVHLGTVVSSMYTQISMSKEDRIAQSTSLPIQKGPQSIFSLSHTTSLSTKKFLSSPRLVPVRQSSISSPRTNAYSASTASTAVSSPRTTNPIPRNVIKPTPASALAQEQKRAEEKLRKEKIAEERRIQLEDAKAVLRERQLKKQIEEFERKRARDEQKEELLDKRKQEEEERKQRAVEIRRAREKRIVEERKKREEKLQQLKQKPATHFADYFKKVDVEEERLRIEAEWKEFQEQMDRERIREEEEERKRVEAAEKKQAEKEAKRKQREIDEANARAEKQQLKARRKAKYEKDKKAADILKQKQEEERKAKSIRDFQEREKRRALKQKLGVTVLPVVQVDYDKSKIFVGGIKLDDLLPNKLGKKFNAVRDERINHLLRIFDGFGEVTSRKVFLEKNHFFITYAKPAMAKKALTTMQNFEERKKAVEQIQESLKANKGNLLAAPHASFYVREPNVKKKKPPQNKAEEEPSTNKAAQSL